ncbi:MAG: hypothetical protein HY547_00885 [Elusimicrobia bacterium]|nr:hypothetical protein [Elusimicrobiota bacterium]
MLSSGERLFLLQAASVIVPEAARLDAGSKEEFLRIIERALETRPVAMQRQFKMLLRLLNLAPVFYYGRTFDTLETQKRREFFSWLQGGPIGLLRKGFWGLKAMVFMGYYGQPEAASTVAYAPSKEGNEKLEKMARV